jgi:uncharacterized small protein (DUF1192 family)
MTRDENSNGLLGCESTNTALGAGLEGLKSRNAALSARIHQLQEEIKKLEALLSAHIEHKDCCIASMPPTEPGL